MVVTWKFDLLPRWALAVLVAREALFLGARADATCAGGGELRITMLGRWAVWPTMAALFAALAGLDPADDVLLYLGLALTLVATAQYVRQASTSA